MPRRSFLGRMEALARVLQPTGAGEYVRRRVVSKCINTYCERGDTVVDLGAGMGNLFGALRPDLRQRYVVVDVEHGSYGLRVIGDVTVAPLVGDSAACVCLSDVLEHLVDDLGAVNEAVRLARPGGHIVLHVPSTRTKPYTFLKRAADAAEAVDHQRFPHVRDGYTDETLSTMLSNVSGADIVLLEPSFAPAQSLLSDIDAWLWWHKLTPLRVVPWLGIRLASLRNTGRPASRTSSGYLSVLRKVPD